MDAVAIISRVDNEWRYVTIETTEDPVAVGQLLKNNWANLDLVVELFNQGNVTTLGTTIEDTVFLGTPYQTIDAVYNQPDDFDIADYNYVLAMDRAGNRFWVMTRMGIDGFHNI